MRLPDSEVRAIMGALGVPDLAQLFQRLRFTPYPEAKKLLEEAQEAVARAWKRKARELHPDLHPDDPEKEEQFKRYSFVVEQFKRLQVAPPRPVMRPFMVVSTSSTTTVGDWTAGVTMSFTTPGRWRTSGTGDL